MLETDSLHSQINEDDTDIPQGHETGPQVAEMEYKLEKNEEKTRH